MEKVSSHNFITIFKLSDNRLNSIFQRNTAFLKGGSVKAPTNSIYYAYEKKLISKENVTIEIDVLYDKERDDYLYYTYNIFFNNNKLMFHYEPTHKEHFQPHINVYIDAKGLKNTRGESIHIISHKYHPSEIINLIERYFG